MDGPDDDRPLGRPVGRARSPGEISPAANAPQIVPDPLTDAGRHAADELLRPRQSTGGLRDITEVERQSVKASEASEAQRAYEQIIRQQATLGRFNSWRKLANSTLLVTGLALFSLTGLFVFAQSLRILGDLAMQPPVIKIAGYTVLLALLAILAIFAARLSSLFVRLRRNEQISTAQLKALSSRAELRALVQSDKVAAKENLIAYLKSYPLDSGGTRAALGLFRLNDETIRNLRDAREFLLDPDRFSDHDSWLRDFQEHFQDKLQGAANKIVLDWMKLVGIQTALSPKGWLDSVIVLYSSYGMIGDLCQLYNLRMTGPGIIRLLALSLFNSYAAGQIEDFVDSVDVDSIVQSVDLETVFDAAHGLGGGLVKKFLPKVAEGTANALLTYKLGHSTIALLRPVNPV